jgi:putative transposase
MAKQRDTVEQIIGKLRQAEVELRQGRSMGEVCRSLGVPEHRGEFISTKVSL